MNKILSVLMLMLLSLNVLSQQVFSLEDCRKMALENNKQLKMASEKIEVASDMKKAAFAQYLPNISANGAYLWNEKNISLFSEDQFLPVGTKMTDGSFGFTQDQVSNKWTVINGQPVPLDASGNPFNPKLNPEKILWKNYAFIPKEAFEFDAQNIYTGALTIVQPIYLGGKIRELNKIASYSKNLAEAQYQGQVSETYYEVDESYWRIISLINKENISKSYLNLLSKLDSNMSVAIQLGVATKSEGLSVKVKLNEAQMMLTKVQDGIALSKMSLCQQCGLALNTQFSLKDENLIPDYAVSGLQKSNAEALQNRYEIQSLKQLVNISEANRKIAFSRYLPNVGLTSSYLITNPNMYNGFSNEFAGMWQIGVAVNIPIFHFGDKYYTVKAANSEKKIAELKLQEAEEKINLEISQSKFKIEEASKKLNMSQEDLLKADENLRYANEGFDAGTITSAVVMEAQTAWLKAKSENIDSMIELKLCQTYLQKASGNLK